jgi:hypothetical protein
MNDYEALQEQYRQLRLAAERVVEAAEYPTADGEEARIYASQLRDLKRELSADEDLVVLTS